MLLMLLLLPGRMVAQTEYDNTVTFKALEGNPEGYDKESYANLFDGKKEDGNFSKWCCKFSGSAYVIFEASKAGIPVGYTITTGNDNANSGCGGRNPKKWKLYGNNTGSDDAWELIDEVKKTRCSRIRTILRTTSTANVLPLINILNGKSRLFIGEAYCR